MDKISEKIKAARIAKGVTIEEVAEATLLSVNIIKDIEDGAFERFVGDELYVKMYLKKIARYLEIDETIADDYYAITREIKKADLKDLENKKEICTDRQIYIYKNKFLLDLDLFFDKNILEFDYLQIIKSIYFASKIKYIKNKNTIEDNILIGGKIFETFTKIFINNNIQNFKNKSFIIYIYDILNFMDSYNLYNERKYFKISWYHYFINF